MTMLAVLVPTEEQRPVLGADVVARLTALGVTSVSLVGNQAYVAWVVEGWRFDPARSGEQVVSLLAPGSPGQALLPLMQALVVPPAEHPAPARP